MPEPKTRAIHEFVFTERCVSLPVYRIRARSLKDAVWLYLSGTVESSSEEVEEDALVSVQQDGQAVPKSVFRRVVDRANQTRFRQTKSRQTRATGSPGIGSG